MHKYVLLNNHKKAYYIYFHVTRKSTYIDLSTSRKNMVAIQFVFLILRFI